MIDRKHMANICFDCKNAVPDNNGHGCPWSRKFEPVPGWDAKPVTVGAGAYTVDTYQIFGCPLFDPEDDARVCIPETSHPIRVRCVETGVVFRSLRLAGQAIGRDGNGISEALKNGRNYAYGYHWEKVDS